MSRLFLGGLLVLLLAAPMLPALDDSKAKTKPADKPKSPAEQYKGITAEYDAKYKAFMDVYQKAKTDQERSKAIQDKYPDAGKYAARVLKVAQANPKEGFVEDALLWAYQHGRGSDTAKRAFDLLLKDHAASKKLDQAVQMLAYETSPATEKTLRTVLEKSPHAKVQGAALLTLAQYFKNRAEYEQSLGQAEKDRLLKEAEKTLEQVLEKYGKTGSLSGPVVKTAERALFELRNLSVGKVAPEITGEDIDGKKFKLSEYRGKVVVLDFWGHW